jgi:hypothetical protein
LYELGAVCEDCWENALTALRGAAMRRPALTALTAALSQQGRVRCAIMGEWRPLGRDLVEQAAACARDGVELRAASAVVSAFADALLPRTVELFRDQPTRLATALRELHVFVARATTAIADGYLSVASAATPAAIVHDDAAALDALYVREVLPRLVDRDTLLSALARAGVSGRGELVLVVDADPRAR